MRREMVGRHSRTWIYSLLLSSPFATARAQEETETSLAERRATAALNVRQVLGYDPVSLAALEVDVESQENVAIQAVSYCTTQLDTLEPLLSQWLSSRAALGNPDLVNDNQAAATALADIETARANIISNTSDLQDAMAGLVDSSIAAVISATEANAGLDPLIRLLDLSTEQRSTIWNATLTRDTVARNPYTWHLTSAVVEAEDDFAGTLNGILDENQAAQLEAYQEAVEAGLQEAAEGEQAAAQFAQQEARAHHLRQFLAEFREDWTLPIRLLSSWIVHPLKPVAAHQGNEHEPVAKVRQTKGLAEERGGTSGTR